jgi:hypothetical protein
MFATPNVGAGAEQGHNHVLLSGTVPRAALGLGPIRNISVDTSNPTTYGHGTRDVRSIER